ncbi:MAG: COX15/CtaA family protein [Gammaproteobacteria bacterium]|jgi:cytochrome c oxidase assembly protein subunit 15|nr:COX15/CtaA family protein [Gammaproteobacteria bacterium]
MKNLYTLLRRISVIAVGFALVVIMLGAWVRLSDAGLGCPDWPACYGHITWPVQDHEIERAAANYPQRPVQVHKAWKEVLHRYFAGVLGLIVLTLAALNWKLRKHYPDLPIKLSLLLVLVIMIQAAFGMWTVTLQLLPWVVTTHLLGGMATAALLFWQARRIRAATQTASQPPSRNTAPTLRPWVLAALLILLLQIALGGWVSSNYAALACIDLPTCQQQWWPQTDFVEGFTIWREIGIDYEGGVLDQAARNAIHISHRIGAMLAFVIIAAMSIQLLRNPITRFAGSLAGLLLLVQIVLGINNIVLLLPLWNAVAHNGVAALLLLAIVNALWRTRAPAAVSNSV